MKVTQVQRILSLYGAGTEKRAEAISTELRGELMLPKGGRGLHAPDVSAEAAVVFSLAVAGSERVSDAPDTAKQLAGLVNKQGLKLIEVLSDAMANARLAAEIHRVLVLPDLDGPEHAMAEISYRDGPSIERFFVPKKWKQRSFVPESQGQGFVGRIGYVGGAVLHKLAIELEEAEEASE